MAKPCILVSEAASSSLKSRLRKLRGTSEKARLEDADGIHDMRVASRRLRAALREHKVVFGKKAYADFQAHVRGVTSSLGKARELDVCLDLLEERRRQVHGAPRHGVIHLVKKLRTLRNAESDKVVASAVSVDTPEFNRTLIEIFESIAANKKCYLKNAARRLTKGYGRLRNLHSLWTSTPSDDILHCIRVRFKKLRYACEIYAPLYGSEMEAFLMQLKNVQGTLGTWNDQRILRNYAAAAVEGAPPRAREGIPVLVEAIDGDIARLIEQFHTNAEGFFGLDQAERTVAFLGAPVISCCRTKGFDKTVFDAIT